MCQIMVRNWQNQGLHSHLRVCTHIMCNNWRVTVMQSTCYVFACRRTAAGLLSLSSGHAASHSCSCAGQSARVDGWWHQAGYRCLQGEGVLFGQEPRLSVHDVEHRHVHNPLPLSCVCRPLRWEPLQCCWAVLCCMGWRLVALPVCSRCWTCCGASLSWPWRSRGAQSCRTSGRTCCCGGRAVVWCL